MTACGCGSDDKAITAPVAPTLAISSDAVGTATGPFTLHFVFNAAPSGVAIDRILISGGYLGQHLGLQLRAGLRHRAGNQRVQRAGNS